MADGSSRRPSRRPSRPRPPRPSVIGPRPNDCSVTLPVEIDVKVKVRSKCKPFGSSRTRGGMSIEYSPEQQMLLNERIMSGDLNIEESNGPIPVLHEILKKQHKILRNLESSSTPSSLSPRKNLSLLSNKRDRATTNQNLNEIVDAEDESSNDEVEENKQNDNEKVNLNVINEKQSEKQSKLSKSKKYTNKNVMSSLSEGIKINRNISFDNNDEISTQDNKKSKKKDKRLKGGQTNIPLASNFEDEENPYQFDIQESQMVELFNRRKFKLTNIDQTNRVGEKNKIEMDKEERTVVQKDKNYGR